MRRILPAFRPGVSSVEGMELAIGWDAPISLPSVGWDTVGLPIARRSHTPSFERLDVGSMTVMCPFCGAHHWMKERITKSSDAYPQFSTCCQRGQVDLPLKPNPPSFLMNVLEGVDNQLKEFHENIRQYNMSLAFTSLGVAEDRLVNRRGGWVLRISGELYHLIGSLHPNDGVVPSYAQLYIYDSHVALHHRMNRNSNLRVDTMATLQTMLLSSHRYAHEFRHAYEILRDHSDAPDAVIRLRVMPGQSSGAYAAPTSDEVAVILPGDGQHPNVVISSFALAPLTQAPLRGSTMGIPLTPHYIMSSFSPMVLMAGTETCITVFVQVRMYLLKGTHAVFLKLNFLHFAYIPMHANTQQFIEVAVCFSSMLSTCGHLLIKHVSHSSDSTKENYVRLFTVAFRTGLTWMK
ncbi:hypothetical protein BC827DRAFT_819539 [Russula dissimulans]|nr:hypothetical protein BC827DRAFT_819539 [Russula dissimulans]